MTEYSSGMSRVFCRKASAMKLADEFSGTDAGNLANAYAGLCYAQLGKYEDAIKYLDKFSGDRDAA